MEIRWISMTKATDQSSLHSTPNAIPQPPPTDLDAVLVRPTYASLFRTTKLSQITQATDWDNERSLNHGEGLSTGPHVLYRHEFSKGHAGSRWPYQARLFCGGRRRRVFG